MSAWELKVDVREYDEGVTYTVVPRDEDDQDNVPALLWGIGIASRLVLGMATAARKDGGDVSGGGPDPSGLTDLGDWPSIDFPPGAPKSWEQRLRAGLNALVLDALGMPHEGQDVQEDTQDATGSQEGAQRRTEGGLVVCPTGTGEASHAEYLDSVPRQQQAPAMEVVQ